MTLMSKETLVRENSRNPNTFTLNQNKNKANKIKTLLRENSMKPTFLGWVWK